MAIDIVPEWMRELEEEDVNFIRNFILASGSLKEIANQYNVSYPTVRLRIDKIIQKIRISESRENDPYISLIKRLAVNDKIDFETAKLLINEYKKEWKEVMNNVIVNILFHNSDNNRLVFLQAYLSRRKASGLDSYCLQYSYFIANMGVILSKYE